MQMAFGILGCTFSICVIVYFVAVGVFWGLVMVCGAYLIFVIFFTRAKFLENKIYTEIYTVNCQFTQ